MVGDSKDNSTVQFRRVFEIGPGRFTLVHPNVRHHMFRIEPVTFDGFSPVVVNKDPLTPAVGQILTAATYGPTDPYNWSSFPGEAHERQYHVTLVSDNSFGATHFKQGGCVGAYDD
jgi:hypothetical protein